MKKNRILNYVLLAMITIVLAACGKGEEGTTKASKDVIEINVSNFQPSTHHYVYNVFEPWKEMVEEKTEGRVKVNLYHGGSLGKSNSVLEDVSGGLADIGLVISTYYYDSNFFPYTIGNLPFAFPDAASASKVMTEFGEKYAQKAFEDVHYLGQSYGTDAYDLFSTKPVKEVADLKGLKMRVQGKADVPIIEKWGAVPVSIPLDDTYEALQKGTLNTAFYSSIGVLGHKYYEVAPHVTKMGISVTPVTPIMNKDVYESLPEDIQKMFDDDFGPKLSQLLTETHTKELENAYKELATLIEGKGEITELTNDDLKGFMAPAKIVWDDWVKEADKKGYPGEEMMEEFKGMLKAEGIELPF